MHDDHDHEDHSHSGAEVNHSNSDADVKDESIELTMKINELNHYKSPEKTHKKKIEDEGEDASLEDIL
tara:strand:+ start:507 stop:710 length:204 start_codon:yes stop_codon:yes gene_type:complete